MSTTGALPLGEPSKGERITVRAVLVVLAAALAFAVVGAAVPAGALASPGDVGFELDGNAVRNSVTAPPYDWADLFDATGGQLLAPDFNPLAASVFASDRFNSNLDDIHTGGGSKDTLGIQSGPRLWTGSKPQGKDDLEHAFAGMLLVPAGQPGAGHKVLVAGVDRFDDSGDATLGVWLLRSPLSESTGTTNGGHPFAGVHEDGDLLFLADFTVGGSSSAPKVFRWTGDDATGSLVSVTAPTTVSCGPAASGLFCNVVNSGPVTTPWPYLNKSGASAPDHGEFTELGVDLTALLGAGNVPCFSTMLAETRSSQSPTATLSDFVIGSSFVTCDRPTITTNAAPGGSAEAPGTSQQDTATITAPDTSTPVTGTITFFLCGPSAISDAGCASGAGTQIGLPVTIDTNGGATSATVSDDTTATLGKYCWRAEYTPDSPAAMAHLPSAATNGTSECFTVVSTDELLSALLTAVTGVGPGKSLANKVKQIQAYLAANDTASACNLLNDFISEVNAQKGKKLTKALADSLIAQADAIKARLGC
jgi:FIMAH domain-containing protein